MFKDIVYGMLMFALGVGTVVVLEAPKPITIVTGSGYVRVKEIQSKELEIRVAGDVAGKTIEVGTGTYSQMQDELEQGLKSFESKQVANEIVFRLYPTHVYRVQMPDGTVGIVKSAQPVVKLVCPVGMSGEICSLSVRNTLATLAVKPD